MFALASLDKFVLELLKLGMEARANNLFIFLYVFSIRMNKTKINLNFGFCKIKNNFNSQYIRQYLKIRYEGGGGGGICLLQLYGGQENLFYERSLVK